MNNIFLFRIFPGGIRKSLIDHREIESFGKTEISTKLFTLNNRNRGRRITFIDRRAQ